MARKWPKLRPRVHASRARYAALAQAVIAAGVDPASPDYLRFGDDRQTIVDAAFLSLALIRAQVKAGNSSTRAAPLTQRAGFRSVSPDTSPLGAIYISTGSLYLATAPLLPLGLPPEDPFWSAPSTPWTSRQVWQEAENLIAEHAEDS